MGHTELFHIFFFMHMYMLCWETKTPENGARSVKAILEFSFIPQIIQHWRIQDFSTGSPLLLRVPTYYLTNFFFQRLHENEEILAQKGSGLVPPLYCVLWFDGIKTLFLWHYFSLKTAARVIWARIIVKANSFTLAVHNINNEPP